MHRLGIVDLGSNTARLVVYAYEPGRWARLEDEIREPVRLGQGFGSGNRLSPAAMERCVAALELFADYGEAAGLPRLVVLATSALRDAENSQDFFQRIAHLDLDLQILQGQEEARLGVLAVANGLSLQDAWVVDLGGGSLEVSLMRNRRFTLGDTFPLGMVRLSERFLRTDPPTKRQIQGLEDELGRMLGSTVDALRRLPFPLVAVGGTIRNLGRAVQKQQGYPLDLLHGYPLNRATFEELVGRLLKLSLRQRQSIPGIRPDRADIILAGALLFRWLLAKTERDGLTISGHGLREGALYQSLLPHPHLKDDVRRFSLDSLLARFDLQSPHVAHVRTLARQAFDGLAPLHGLGARDADLLDAAAALHDVGMRLSFYRHAHHGMYLLGSQPLPGFSHVEQAEIMLLVRYHEKGTLRLNGLEPLVKAEDRPRLLCLAACLRLAEHLERSRSGRIRGLRITHIDKRRVAIHLQTEESPSVEIWETVKLAGALFREAFGRRLVLVSDFAPLSVGAGRSRAGSP